MLLEEHAERRFVEIWLTSDEAQTSSVKENLKEIFAECKQKNILWQCMRVVRMICFM